MKTKMLFIAISMLALWSCQPAGTSNQQDTTETDTVQQATPAELPAQMAATLLENDYVAVKKMTVSPGAEQPLHEGGPRVVYSLSDYKISWQEGKGDPSEEAWTAGDVHWHDAGTHAVKNLGESEASFLVAMRKDATLPPCGEEKALQNDINQIAPDKAAILFENEHARVTKVMLEAGNEIPEHAGTNRVIYSLTDYTITYASEKEAAAERSFTAGEAHWHEACRHSLSNTGETTAEFLVIAFKN